MAITDSVHCAAGDGDVFAAAAAAAAADAGTMAITDSVHCAAGDGNVFAAAVVAAADARTIVATLNVHRAAVDGDVFAAAPVTAADAGTIPTTGSVHCAAVDGNVFAAAVVAAADAGTIVATGSGHLAAGDGDVFAAAAVTAADAGTKFVTDSGHPAALDGDVFAVAVAAAAANAGTTASSFGSQAAVFIIVLQGQRACGVRGVFFKARPVKAAFQLVIAVQLDLHIALSLNAQGSFSVFKIRINVASGAAHIDLYVFQGELQRLIGKVVDHRNDVVTKARGIGGSRSRGCLLGLGLLVCALLPGVGSSRGCLLGLLPGAFLPVGALLPVSVLRLVGIFRFLSVLRLVCAFRLLGVLRLLSVLRLGRGSGLVVVLHHRAKAGILCCGAFQVALHRGLVRIRGGDDDLTTIVLRSGSSVLFAILNGLFAILIFGDGNIAVVDVVGPCKGRSRQRHRDAQRRHQSCCPAECVGLPHGIGLLSFSTLSCAFCALFVEGAFF